MVYWRNGEGRFYPGWLRTLGLTYTVAGSAHEQLQHLWRIYNSAHCHWLTVGQRSEIPVDGREAHDAALDEHHCPGAPRKLLPLT